MYFYYGSSLEGTIVLLIIAISITALVMGTLGLSVYICIALNKIRRYIKRRGDKQKGYIKKSYEKLYQVFVRYRNEYWKP